MSITVGVITKKILELRSQKTFFQTMVQQIEANYLESGDGLSAELQLFRDDGGKVTPDHFQSIIDRLHENIAQIDKEVMEWEDVPLNTADSDDESEDAEASDDEEDEETPPKVAPLRNKKNGRRRSNQDRSAAK
jgi:hypothetical protein